MLSSGKKESVISIFRDRELGNRCAPHFLSWKVASQLIRSKSRSSLYPNYWKRTSHRDISYDTGYLYFSNYTEYCALRCVNEKLPPLHPLGKTAAKKRVSDALSYTIPVYKNIDDICKCSPQPCICLSQYILSVSEDNWLCQHLMKNGKLIKTYYINRFGHKFLFKYCNWDIYGERFILSSTLNPGANTGTAKKGDTVVNLAIFTAFPIEFFALLEIKRSVFGENCTAVNTTEQLLIIGLGQSYVHIYNFDDFLKGGSLTPYKLGDRYEYGTVGSYPTGLPLNFTYKSAPPLLFKVMSFGQTINFGGYPYHYINFNPYRCSTYSVINLEANDLQSIVGHLSPSIFNDPVVRVTFHPDHSNRLIFKHDTAIDLYKLSFENGESRISKQFSMGSSVVPPVQPKKSLFGRVIKFRNYNPDFVNECFVYCSDYSSDLNLFAILCKHPTDEKAFVKMYDNVTGELIRTLELSTMTNLCESHFYQLYVDMDSIVIIERSLPATYYNVHVFYM